jgi:hypothetical protein
VRRKKEEIGIQAAEMGFLTAVKSCTREDGIINEIIRD